MLQSPFVRIVSGVVVGMATLTFLHYQPPWHSTGETGPPTPGRKGGPIIDEGRDKLTVGFLPVT